jgi:hypothetical protein
VKVAKGITALYQSSDIQELLADRFERDPNEMMIELKGSISDAGTLLDPSKWGIKNKDSGDSTLNGSRTSEPSG